MTTKAMEATTVLERLALDSEESAREGRRLILKIGEIMSPGLRVLLRSETGLESSAQGPPDGISLVDSRTELAWWQLL